MAPRLHRAVCVVVASWLATIEVSLAHAKPRGHALDVEQVIIVRTPNDTTVKLHHELGDAIAFLDVVRPPRDLVATMAKQVGPMVDAVERESYRDDVLRIALRLREAMVELRLDQTTKPRSFIIGIRRRALTPPPQPSQLIGQINGLYPAPTTPVVLPPVPRQHPCIDVPVVLEAAKNSPPGTFLGAVAKLLPSVKEVDCADHLSSLLAARDLSAGADVAKHERWAFTLAHRAQWKNAPLACRRARLIAALVLSRRGMLREAEAILSSKSSATDRGYEFHFSLALAEVEQASARFEDAHALIDGMMRHLSDAPDPYAVYAARAVAFHRAGDFARALDAALSVPTLPNVARPEDGLLWRVGGDSALALAKLDLAHRLFSGAVGVEDETVRAAVEIRLGDIAVRRSASSAVDRDVGEHYAKARKLESDPCIGKLVALRDTVLEHARDPNVELEPKLASFAERANCDLVRLEASHAVAALRASALEEPEALAYLAPFFSSESGQRSVHPVATDAIRALANTLILRKARHGEWLAIAETYESLPAAYQREFSPLHMLSVARAYREIGLPQRGSAIALELMKVEGTSEFREQCALELARAYLAAGDSFRLHLVAKFVETQHPASPWLWDLRQMGATSHLLEGDASAALELVDAGKVKIPRGDPEARTAVLRAAALVAMEKFDAGAKELGKVLESDFDPGRDSDPWKTKIVSACVRSCSDDALANLVRALSDARHSHLLDERVAFFVRGRGIAISEGRADEDTNENAKASDSVWKRLSSLADRAVARSP